MSTQLLSLKKNYNVTDNTTRKLFIERVFCQRKKPIKEIAKELGIKYSTAKAIIRVYKSEGRTDKKSKKIHKKKMNTVAIEEKKERLEENVARPIETLKPSNTNNSLAPIVPPPIWNAFNPFLQYQFMMNNQMMLNQMMNMQLMSQHTPSHPLLSMGPGPFFL